MIDIEALEFIDSSGVRLLLEVERTCEQQGITFNERLDNPRRDGYSSSPA